MYADDQLSYQTSCEYRPARVFDAVAAMIGVRSGIGLAQALGITAAELSRVRCSGRAIGASILVRLHEVSGLSTKALRRIALDRRQYYRPSGFKTGDAGTIQQRRNGRGRDQVECRSH